MYLCFMRLLFACKNYRCVMMSRHFCLFLLAFLLPPPGILAMPISSSESSVICAMKPWRFECQKSQNGEQNFGSYGFIWANDLQSMG